jgi:hypothetical protein
MPRLLPSAVKEAINAQETSEGFIILLEITDNSDHTQYFCDDTTDRTDGVNTYVAYPFEIQWPQMVEGRMTEGSLTFDNVSRILVEVLRSQPRALRVKIKVALLSDISVIAAETPQFYWRSLTFTPTTITGTLLLDSIIGEPFPKDLMSGKLFPALFYQ